MQNIGTKTNKSVRYLGAVLERLHFTFLLLLLLPDEQL